MDTRLALVLAVVLLIRLPFLNQAIQGDDVYYLAAAEHAQIDPLDPNHVQYVFLGDRVDLRGFPHPPFNAWFLALLLAVTGDIREVPFQIGSSRSQPRPIRFPGRSRGPARFSAPAFQRVVPRVVAGRDRRYPRSAVPCRLHSVLGGRGAGDVVAGEALFAASAMGHAAVCSRAGVRRQRQLARIRSAVSDLLDG